MKYDDSENMKTDCVNTVVFNLHQIKQRNFSLGHPVHDSIFRPTHTEREIERRHSGHSENYIEHLQIDQQTKID